MIRPFTTLCVLAVMGSGFYLFQTKNTAMLLDRDIARIMKQVDQARERTGLLRAEYARLTGPGPLGELAGQFLPELKATLPSQYAALPDLERRLPAIGLPQPVQPLEPQAPDAAPPRAEPARVEPARVETARVETARVETAKPAAVAGAQRAMVAGITPAPGVFGPVVTAAVAPPVRVVPVAPRAVPVVSAPAPVAAQPVMVPVMAAAQPVARPAARSSLAGAPASPIMPAVMRAPPATPAEAVARIARGEPVNPSVPAVASALGMARTMSPSAITPVQAATLQPGSLR